MITLDEIEKLSSELTSMDRLRPVTIDGEEFLVARVHPDIAKIALAEMTPKQKWKYKNRNQRLARRMKEA